MKKKQVEIRHPPLFIVGHYRSGTSLLHELLDRDENVRFMYICVCIMYVSCVCMCIYVCTCLWVVVD